MKNKTRLLARVMLVVNLLTISFSLVSCGIHQYEWEVYSHEDYVKKIEQFNSIHNGYVDTFIGFDLDNNGQVSKKIYWAFSQISTGARKFERKHGYICDIHEDGLAQIFIFYLKDDELGDNDYAYKIKCSCTRAGFNFTEEDKIEILKSKCEYYPYREDDPTYDPADNFMYEKSRLEEKKQPMYNYTYHYSMYVNDTRICCFHISSIDEASEEKLAEFVQMLYDSLVILNTEKFFIWRDEVNLGV